MNTPESRITSSIDMNSTLDNLIEDSIGDRLDNIEEQLIRIEDKLDQIAESLNL